MQASTNSINRVKGIIFDCDGVMIDSAEANRHLYNYVLNNLGLPSMTAEQENFAFQATFQDALEKLVPENLHQAIPGVVEKIDYDRDVASRINLMPGLRDFIDMAHAKGLRMAIDTNRTDFGIDRILDIFNLPPYFDPVISSSRVSKPKPSPMGVEKILESWGMEPSSVIFVGDSEDDRKAAKDGGVLFAAFGPGLLAGDIKVASWKDLAKDLWVE